MALFWSKKSKSEKPAKVAKVSGQVAGAKAAKGKTAKAEKGPKNAVVLSTGISTGNFGASADAILRPHVTEKAGLLAQNNVYTFQVAKNSNKSVISKAVFSLYKVKPVKIAVINLPAKNIFVKGRWGVVSGTRKAMVTLKKGDKIDFV
jgi:large subunit ribosomal protein L23